MSVKVAIDGENFARDRRGMGRFARTVAKAAIADPELDVTLLFRQRESAATFSETFADGTYAIAGERNARRKRDFDVCWFPWNGMRYRSGAPAVVTVHDTFAFDEPAGDAVARFREQKPIERAMRQASRIVFDSRWSAQQATQRFDLDPERVSVVPLAPDAFFRPGPLGALVAGLGKKRFVLFVSSREPRKNARLIFEACARALDPNRETLVVAGSVARADALRLRMYGVPHVRVEANDEALRSLYRSAVVVAVPSRSEGFGLVAAEALACGAAVIAADAAALPEACGGAAWLIDPDDVDGWTHAVRALLDDPALRATYAALAIERWAPVDRLSFAHDTIAILKRTAQRA